jgi:hypothetical protein
MLAEEEQRVIMLAVRQSLGVSMCLCVSMCVWATVGLVMDFDRGTSVVSTVPRLPGGSL